jgi:peptidase M66-like protein
MFDYVSEKQSETRRRVTPARAVQSQPAKLGDQPARTLDTHHRADAASLRTHAADLQRLASSPRQAQAATHDLQHHYGNHYVEQAVGLSHHDSTHDGNRVYPVRGAVGAAVGAAVGGPVGALIGGLIGATHKNVTVNISELTGAGGSVGPDFVRANVVWAQANISVLPGNHVTGVSGAGILDAANVLDESRGPVLTAAETALVTGNRTPGRITLYYVPSMSDGSRGEEIDSGYFGPGAGPDASVVVSSSARAGDTFAHELGHALGLAHAPYAWQLMASGTIRWTWGPNLLSPWEISTARASRYAT